ncbi:hypothetical protein AKJ56_01135 [candidate division MSBL1 archaeon SCGC-AAA382N08]|uniref:Uncharacterized protein n=1 Tax=candidate division MSBL1 archaeon SCGC-AAA382N08 TaxID=1698285 RepID=A0A133VQ01_9EURY|nr:hypothetical protein AKJ56_01135 [candidate division MSBL1 archaeon SCGC-AAA382N08]
MKYGDIILNIVLLKSGRTRNMHRDLLKFSNFFLTSLVRINSKIRTIIREEAIKLGQFLRDEKKRIQSNFYPIVLEVSS